MIEFDDKDIQKEFNECHFRKEFDGVDICRGMCAPCSNVIESGQYTGTGANAIYANLNRG